MANSVGFPETWNFTSERLPPPQFDDIREWVNAILLHTLGVREWACFYKRYGRKPITGTVQRTRAPLLASINRRLLLIIHQGLQRVLYQELLLSLHLWLGLRV